MELKRYVLLSDSTILTKKEFNEQRKVDDFYADRLFKKTSDNILDLVEVEDLVGYRFWGEDYEHIEKMTSEKRRIEKIAYNECWYQILAIYKRQTNGDYKRYEVVK